MGFEYIKALYIILVLAWFAGVFHSMRLFIYQTGAMERSPSKRHLLKPQLDMMASRLCHMIT
jgi:putative membrane protein